MFRMAMIALTLGACAPVNADAGPPNPRRDAVAIGQRLDMGPFTLTSVKVVEDSRCPKNVVCVWAGRLRLSVRIVHRGAVSEPVLELGEPHAVAGGMLTLTKAEPYPEHGAEPRPYRFAFTLE